MVSKLPRKQRKAVYEATHHEQMSRMSVHLSDELIKKYKRRAIPVRAGDIVRVMRGEASGKEGKVVTLYPKQGRVAIEGINIPKADKSEVAQKIHVSNLLLKTPDLGDRWRRKRLEVSE
ncbi:MAG: 50S ribosomal protein L24 [Candidatus Thermoplasmatota archaeon]